MIRAALLASLICLVLAAQSRAQDFPAWVTHGQDTVEIEAISTAQAQVIYYNHAAQSSSEGGTTLSIELGDDVVVVDVFVTVNGGDDGLAELAEVRPHGDYIAVPDRLSVTDGDKGVFQIMRPMF